MIPLLSKPVLDEYRAVLAHPDVLERFPKLSARDMAFVITRLLFVGDYVRSPRAHFTYDRDPRDEKFIELAIDLLATHILSSDNDLLSLPQSRTDAGRRFRQRLPDVPVLEASQFLERYEAELLDSM